MFPKWDYECHPSLAFRILQTQINILFLSTGRRRGVRGGRFEEFDANPPLSSVHATVHPPEEEEEGASRVCHRLVRSWTVEWGLWIKIILYSFFQGSPQFFSTLVGSGNGFPRTIWFTTSTFHTEARGTVAFEKVLCPAPPNTRSNHSIFWQKKFQNIAWFLLLRIAGRKQGEGLASRAQGPKDAASSTPSAEDSSAVIVFQQLICILVLVQRWLGQWGRPSVQEERDAGTSSNSTGTA